ncbi:MAG TPA: GIY-YIG nuclease family protein [Bacteriovoracaceae bacterium]|nr:GIY-YIG nuclease family protein [Bacteriovoracaceae bacterium]
MKDSSWFVYIIQNEKGHLYAGITTDVDRRFKEHQSSPKGAKFFRSCPPVKILYTRGCRNRSEASKLEAQIKKLTRLQKLSLIGEQRMCA